MKATRRQVVVIGAGGHAREVVDLLEACKDEDGALEPIGFLVDAAFRPREESIYGLPVLGGIDWLERNAALVEVIVGVGAPELRLRLAKRASEQGARFATAIHPTASLTRRVTIGEGSIIMAGSRLTSNITLGAHVHVTQNCTVAHDVLLGDYVSVYPGANLSGNVRLGEGVLVGAGAVLVEKTQVGSWSRIGAGSTVLSSFGENVTAVGAPARVVRVRQPGWQLEIEP